MEEIPIKILVVDDHDLVREGLMALLDLKPHVEVIGEAADGEEAVKLARELNPDVILLDLIMPKKDGITALQEIRADNTEAKVLILTSFIEEGKVKEVLDAGASGFQLKEASLAELLTAIQAVNQGNFFSHPRITKRILKGLDNLDQPALVGGNLTERELDVLKLVASGYTNREIADILYISDRTVSTHVSHILGKLGVDNRIKAAIKALSEGLVELEDE